jgi:hypothetical protein
LCAVAMPTLVAVFCAALLADASGLVGGDDAT